MYWFYWLKISGYERRSREFEDWFAATRRAIVRAAAEIGKAMK